MTHEEIFELINTMGFPAAYHHFEEGNAQEPPFLVYMLPESRNVSADNRVYKKIQLLQIELYTDEKNISAELQIESILDEAGFFWQKSETWIEYEKLYEVIYEMEVIIDGKK